MRVEEGFHQTPYVEDNPYTSDPVLPGLLKRLLPERVRQDVEPDLERFGKEVLTTMRSMCERAEPPHIIQYNHQGNRIDDLRTSEGWRGLKAIAQREGLVAISHERTYQEYSRVYAFAKTLLQAGDSQVIMCPMSMTDGCARVIELIGSPAMKEDILPRLISRDPAIAFTSGQWMTERPGGSDVSRTETTATPAPGVSSPYGQPYDLDGFKWFTSAIDSDVSIALARTGPASLGSRSLSLFLVPLRKPLLRPPSTPTPPSLTNNILVHRLKNKFGTKIVPTAELSLIGTEAYLLGDLNEGVRLITPVLNITRVHSAVMSLGSVRKALAIATAHSHVRAVEGGKRLLREVPLHVAELARITVLYHALVQLTFGTILLLGRSECGVASQEEELRLRLLTPVAKAFAADKACTAMEECMTMLGGEGYMEENGIGRLIQDSMVEKIWEGTITVLSLDVVRAVQKSQALNAFITWADRVVSSCPSNLNARLSSAVTLLRAALDDLRAAYELPIAPLVPRPAIFLLSHIAAGLYLLEHTIWAHNTGEITRDVDADVFVRWIEEGGLGEVRRSVARAKKATSERLKNDASIVYGSKLAGVAPRL